MLYLCYIYTLYINTYDVHIYIYIYMYICYQIMCIWLRVYVYTWLYLCVSPKEVWKLTKLPTIWTDEQSHLRRSSATEKIRKQKIRDGESQKKEDAGERKVGKSRNTVFFQCFVAPEGRKVGSLKWRVRSQLTRWEMKNGTPLWREAHLEVKSGKRSHDGNTFGSWDVEKVHAVVARSTFGS